MGQKSVVGLNAKGEQEKFPQVWQNTVSGELFQVMPWMQVITGDEIAAVPIPDTAEDGKPQTVRTVFGALAQIGWMIENGNGVHFGIGLNAEKSFESLGEL
jgi:hypothetical protein